MNTTQFSEALKTPFAWPGGYPTFFLCSDGGCLCHACAKENERLITDSMKDGYPAEWIIEDQEINWESTDLRCDNCYKPIESAYVEAR